MPELNIPESLLSDMRANGAELSIACDEHDVRYTIKWRGNIYGDVLRVDFREWARAAVWAIAVTWHRLKTINGLDAGPRPAF